ncbi:hypothetical protein AC579_2985 [Pseudocercospora musae]|uniref:Uncharacterized protein n=1 Tax=Pseudocercospora musae TaxID=113226 RepID=A0A139I7Y3_9PEZI|nr:hypothetical protein AC579_2985 [Pseudocercospora musae]
MILTDEPKQAASPSRCPYRSTVPSQKRLCLRGIFNWNGRAEAVSRWVVVAGRRKKKELKARKKNLNRCEELGPTAV